MKVYSYKKFLDSIFTIEEEDLKKQFIISIFCRESSGINCYSIFWDLKELGITPSLGVAMFDTTHELDMNPT